MGFYNSPADSKPHAGSLCRVLLKTATVKAFKDQSLLGRIDTYSSICNADGYHIHMPFCANDDRSTCIGIFGRILEKVADHLFQQRGVRMNGQLIINLSLQRMLIFYPGAGIACSIHQMAYAYRVKVHLNLLGIQLCHLHCFGDKQVKSIAFLINNA